MLVRRYQLATVNTDKIDAACDNLFVGEVMTLLCGLHVLDSS